MKYLIDTDQKMQEFGKKLGASLTGGEVIELIGDLGAGKTTLVKGIAKGLLIDEPVQSPTFTISRTYDSPRDGLRLIHYDLYRLKDVGIMADEIYENSEDKKNILIIEWAETAYSVLDEDRIKININYLPDGDDREVIVSNYDKEIV